MATELYPLRFMPVYKDYLWGGQLIPQKYHRQAPPGVYAESWEISDRLDGMGVACNGPLAGATFRSLVQRFGQELMGTKSTTPAFPLLIKLIDAREKLSVQVHPDDESARKFGGEAKTEMWYVLDAQPGSALYCGLKPGVDRAKLEQAIRTRTVESLLNRIPVQAGDAVYVPGGRVHAIDAGCLIFEVQQNSNTTYRVYDWGRVGADGKPRPLHIAEALRVINWNDAGSPKVQPTQLVAQGETRVERLINSPYFRVERYTLADPCNCHGDGSSFRIFFVMSGTLQLTLDGHEEVLTPGSSCLVPAAVADCPLDPVDGPVSLLRITLP